MARDAIAATLAVPSETIAVDLVIPQVAPVLRGVRESRSRSAAAVAAEEQILAEAAHTLFEDLRVSQGDACRLLGMSQQEVARLFPLRASRRSRPGHPDPAPSMSTPARTNRNGPDFSRHLTEQQRPRPSLGNGSPGSTDPARPKRNRSPSPTRPSWAIAEDDA